MSCEWGAQHPAFGQGGILFALLAVTVGGTKAQRDG